MRAAPFGTPAFSRTGAHPPCALEALRAQTRAHHDRLRVQNATIMYLLGIDHERLTFKFQGRYFRLTDVHGKVVRPILA